MASRNERANSQGEKLSTYRRFIRIAIVLMAAWTVLCIVSAEVIGFPTLYGWPLLVIRPDGCSQPPAWIILADVAAAGPTLTATVLAALWCRRTLSHQTQFRLSTLFGAIAVIAAIAAIWRADHDGFWVTHYLWSGPETDGLATSLMFNPTLLLHWQPAWFPPLPLIRVGVLLGLACTIHIAGRSFIELGKRCFGLTRRNHPTAGPDSK